MGPKQQILGLVVSINPPMFEAALNLLVFPFNVSWHSNAILEKSMYATVFNTGILVPQYSCDTSAIVFLIPYVHELQDLIL